VGRCDLLRPYIGQSEIIKDLISCNERVSGPYIMQGGSIKDLVSRTLYYAGRGYQGPYIMQGGAIKDLICYIMQGGSIEDLIIMQCEGI